MRYREHISSAGVRSGEREKYEDNGGWKDERDIAQCFWRPPAPGSYGTPVRDMSHMSITEEKKNKK
jgi:hypothetical protein